jgi:competence protein ComEA
MKFFIGMIIFSLVYLVGMDVINRKLETIDFGGANKIIVDDNMGMYSVSILGAVKNPGTYTMERGDKLSALIAKAGGLSDNADSSTYNLDVSVENGATYYIAYKSDTSDKISINTATIAMLDTLPGIGNVIASRIVSYRNSKGLFEALEEIKNVSGIGDALFEQIKDSICL